MERVIKFNFIWDWNELGIGLSVAKTPMNCEWKYMIDIYILWGNIWVQFGKVK